MKYFYSIACLFIANFTPAFAVSETQNLHFEPLLEKEIGDMDQKIPYFKLGSSLLFQDCSIGYRIKDEENRQAIDHSLNCHICAPFAGGLVSYKYCRLDYKSYSLYRGIGLELGWAFSRGIGVYPIPLPNIDLILGKEFSEKNWLKWTQTEIHLVPAVLTAYYIVNSGSWGDWDGIVTAILASSVVSVSFAF